MREAREKFFSYKINESFKYIKNEEKKKIKTTFEFFLLNFSINSVDFKYAIAVVGSMKYRGG